MNTATVVGLGCTVLIGLGLYGLAIEHRPLRKLISFNLVGNGTFLYLGVVAQRGAVASVGGDPVPQALVITGIVVAFAATALAVALMLRLYNQAGHSGLGTDRPADRAVDGDAR